MSSIHSNVCPKHQLAIGLLRDQLKKDGFTVLEQWAHPEHIHQIRKAAEKQINKLAKTDRDKVKSLGCIIPCERSRRLTGLGLNPDLLADLSKLVNEDVLFHQGVCFSKPAKSPGTFWHQDYYAWNETRAYANNAGQFQVLVYLRDTGAKNGALRVIPGSHINNCALHKKWGEELQNLDVVELTRRLRTHDKKYTWAYEKYDSEVTVSAKAGDLIVIDSRLMHAAHPNDSEEERELLTLFYLSGVDKFSSQFKKAIYQDWLMKSNEKVNDMYMRFLLSNRNFEEMDTYPEVRNRDVMQRFPEDLIKLGGE